MIKKSIVQKIVGLALLVTLSAPLGACSKGEQTTPENTPETTETPADTENAPEGDE